MTNDGNATLDVSTVTLNGASPADFSVTSDTCSSTAVAPGAHCAISVAFGPTATGGRSADLAITDSAPGSPHTVALTGNGTVSPSAAT